MQKNRSRTGSKKNKAEKLEAAGDKLAKKGNFKKALKRYEEASKADPERAGLYDKMVDAHERSKGEWSREDFVESLTWTMKKQEIEEPAIRQLHAKLAPEWKRTVEMAMKLLDASEDEKLGPLIERYVATGEVGTRVLIELLRMVKQTR